MTPKSLNINLVFFLVIKSIFFCMVNSTDLYDIECDEGPEVKRCAIKSISNQILNDNICHSNRNIVVLQANGLQIQDINKVTFSNCFALKSVDLSNNSLKSLSRETFYANPLLEEVILAGNPIASLPLDIFDRSTNLKRLDLSRNRLHQLPSDIFKNLQHLSHLSITGNPLIVFDVEEILNFTRELQEIDLTNTHLPCQRLERIHTILRQANISILVSSSTELNRNRDTRNYDVSFLNTSTCLNEEQSEYQSILVAPAEQQISKLLKDVRVLNRNQDQIINRLLELENNFKFLEQGLLKIMTEMRQEMNQLKISIENSEKERNV